MRRKTLATIALAGMLPAWTHADMRVVSPSDITFASVSTTLTDPGTVSRGNSDQVEVRSRTLSQVQGGDNRTVVTFAHFDIGSIPAGSVIDRATLTATYDSQLNDLNTSDPASVGAVATAWDTSGGNNPLFIYGWDYTVTNTAALNPQVLVADIKNTAATGQTVTGDFTSTVQGWFEGSLDNHGLVFFIDGVGAQGAGFNNVELTIEYSEFSPPRWLTVEAEDYAAQSGTRLEACSDTGGGTNVAYISNGDWCRYGGIVMPTGDALMKFRVARPATTSNAYIQVRLDAADGPLLGQVDVPVTDGWQSWETLYLPVSFANAGNDVVLVFNETTNAVGASLFNLNWWARAPIVEAEDQDAGSGYRFENTSDVGGGQNLSYISAGEWMEYTIDVETAGLHRIDFRVASDGGGDGIALVGGGETNGVMAVADTGGWQVWETQSTYVNFSETGVQTLRLEFLGGGFNLNWFSYESVSADPIAITVGNTLKQQMRYGIDYERLWFWSGAAALKDTFAEWSVDDCDVDYVRVAISAKYELNEGIFREDAYFDADDTEDGQHNNDRIIPMMQDMQAANPDIKFFASPRPLNEAYETIGVAKSSITWQPYPIWITGAASYSSSSFSFDEVKCSEYLLRYLILMKHYGLKISYMDLSNEWNFVNAQDVRDIRALFDDYLDGTKPVVHPDYPDVTLTAEDIPRLIAPSAWSYTQGSSWMSSVLFNSYREALDIASCHNTDKGGTAQDFADKVNAMYEGYSQAVPEIWNTEVHGWKSTSDADEVLTFAYMLECINAGFSGLNGWLAVGYSDQGHCYIVNKQRSVKYYIFKKLTTTSNRGYALEVNEPDEFKVYWDSDPDQSDADSAVSALIRGNLMTVWVLNHSDTDYPITIRPTGRTISDEPITFTRWSQVDGVDAEGETGRAVKLSDTSVLATVQDNSAYCFEILLEPETVPYVRFEAESYDASNPGSPGTEACSDTGGGLNLTAINDGNWTSYAGIDLDHADSIRLRVAAPAGQADGKIEIRTGSATGPLIGKVAVPVTGGWQNWCTIETPLDPTNGTHTLCLKYVEADSNETASGEMFNLNWFELAQTQTPSSIAETPVSGTQVTLTWNAVPGAIGYTVKRSMTPGGSYAIVDDTITETTYTDAGLTAGVTYYYVIVARYGNGEESAESGEVVAVPSNPIVVEELNFVRPQLNAAGDNVDIELLNSEPGHIYQGQERKDLAAGDWTDVGTPRTGNGGVIVFDFPASPADAACFYRITIERQ
ncbi:carbohydrate-binding protein [Pontiella sp.]|uniref:carbohydrate-binding protein n=1 Tax=Pontiella sp. TaxID=2837462 RepID=UPI003566076B